MDETEQDLIDKIIQMKDVIHDQRQRLAAGPRPRHDILDLKSREPGKRQPTFETIDEYMHRRSRFYLIGEKFLAAAKYQRNVLVTEYRQRYGKLDEETL